MFLNSTHFEYSDFFAHFSKQQIEDFISLAEKRKFVAGEIFSLNHYLVLPQVFQGKSNISAISRPVFSGVFPFSRFSDIIQLRFQSPSVLFVWKVEKLARFFQKNPILISPYLNALKDKNIVLTNYGIRTLDRSPYIASFLAMEEKSSCTSSAWAYARLIKTRDENKKILFIDAGSNKSSSIFTKLSIELPVSAYHVSKGESFEFEKRIQFHKDSGIDLFNFSVGGEQQTDIILIQNILAHAHHLYDVIIIDIPFSLKNKNLSYVLENSSGIFIPVSYSGQILKFLRYKLENNISGGQTIPLPITLKKKYRLRSNLHYIKTDSQFGKDINSYTGEEKISRYLQQYLPPQSSAYALSMGSSLLSSFLYLGALQNLSEELAPAKVVAAAWSSFIAALYCLHGDAVQVEKIILRHIPEFNARSIFEIVFPKKGLVKSDKLKSFLKSLFGDSSFSDLKIPLSLRVLDAGNQNLVFIDSGPLIPALLSALLIPGLMSKSGHYPGYKQELYGDYFYPDHSSLFYLRKTGWKKTIQFSSGDSFHSLRNKYASEVLPDEKIKKDFKVNAFDALLFPYLFMGNKKSAEFSLKQSNNRSFYFSNSDYWQNIENIPTIIKKGYKQMEEYKNKDTNFISRFLENK